MAMLLNSHYEKGLGIQMEEAFCTSLDISTKVTGRGRQPVWAHMQVGAWKMWWERVVLSDSFFFLFSVTSEVKPSAENKGGGEREYWSSEKKGSVKQSPGTSVRMSPSVATHLSLAIVELASETGRFPQTTCHCMGAGRGQVWPMTSE